MLKSRADEGRRELTGEILIGIEEQEDELSVSDRRGELQDRQLDRASELMRIVDDCDRETRMG